MVLQVHGCIQIMLMGRKSLNMGTFIIVFFYFNQKVQQKQPEGENTPACIVKL